MNDHTAHETMLEGMENTGGGRGYRSQGEDLSALFRYSKDVAQYNVFTREQEVSAARDIESADVECWTVMLEPGPQATDLLEYLIGVLSSPRYDDEGNLESVDHDLSEIAKRLREHVQTNTSQRNAMVQSFALQLRYFDFDKSLIVNVRDRFIGSFSYEQAARVRTAFRTRDKARHRFACANLRLAVCIARRYRRLGRMSIADLVQNANLGLLQAIDRYDARQGYKFSTYASWWIRHAIMKGITDHGRMIRMPMHVSLAMHQIMRAQQVSLAQTGKELTNAELIEQLGLSRERVGQVLDYLRIDTYLFLDRPISEEFGTTHLDLVADEDRDSPFDTFAKMESGLELRALLSVLSPMEQKVIRLRFGLDTSGHEYTLKEIGLQHGLTRERIRQIQVRALAKLRDRLHEI